MAATASASHGSGMAPAVEHGFGTALSGKRPNPAALDNRGRPAAGPYQYPPEAWSPDDYDGVALATDGADLTSLPSVHAVYLYHSDAANRFGQFAAMFQRDARRASEMLNSLYGRGIRFDERLGADGATRYLDITVVKSRYTNAQLGSASHSSRVTHL